MEFADQLLYQPIVLNAPWAGRVLLVTVLPVLPSRHDCLRNLWYYSPNPLLLACLDYATIMAWRLCNLDSIYADALAAPKSLWRSC